MAVRVARGLVGRGDAEEVAQEAIVQAYISLGRLQKLEGFDNWLFGIVLNVGRSYLRSQKRAPLSYEELLGGMRIEPLPLVDVGPDVHEVAEAHELRDTVFQSVEMLSPKNKVATLMYYYGQLSVDEIAMTLGVSAGAVKGRLHKSRAHLRQTLDTVRRQLTHTQQRKEMEMIEVSVLAVAWKTSEVAKGKEARAVTLVDEKGRWVLPLWIGPNESDAIAVLLTDTDLPRPMTYQFMANLLVAGNVDLIESRVERLEGTTYYGAVRVGGAKGESIVDCRPSDAIALALAARKPILVADEVMDQAGQPLPDDADIAALRRSSTEEMQEKVAEWLQIQPGTLKPPSGTAHYHEAHEGT